MKILGLLLSLPLLPLALVYGLYLRARRCYRCRYRALVLSSFEVPGKHEMRVYEDPWLVSQRTGIPEKGLVGGLRFHAVTTLSKDGIIRVMVPHIAAFMSDTQIAYGVLAHEAGHHCMPMQSMARQDKEIACDQYAMSLGYGPGLRAALCGFLRNGGSRLLEERIHHLTKAPV